MADPSPIGFDRVKNSGENRSFSPPSPDGTSAGQNEERKIDESDDKELYDLLDSALEDFKGSADKPIEITPSTSNQAVKETVDGTSTAATVDEEWSDEFIEHATTQFQDAMKAFLGDDDSLREEFRRMAEETGKAMSSHEPGSDLSESLAQTLKGLAENAEAVSNDLSDEEISQLLSNIGLSSEDSGENESEDLLNVMKNVMQNLLSKELLYPAIKEIVDKYPNWLAENRPTMPEEDHDKYRQQYELMKKACEEFEAEKDDDPADLKKARFQRILDLMQKMQTYGHPPKDLIGDMSPGFELDEQGNLKMPGLPSLTANGAESCSLM